MGEVFCKLRGVYQKKEEGIDWDNNILVFVSYCF